MRQAALNLNLNLKKTRKREFLEQMEQVVPWADLSCIPECSSLRRFRMKPI